MTKMASWDYPRTEEHNRHISEAKKRFYANPVNLAKHREAQMGIKKVSIEIDISKKCIKRKGVLYYLFECIDCGELHYSQKIKGLPRNPSCRRCGWKKSRLKHIGLHRTPESKSKTSASLMGHPGSRCKRTTEMKKKQSEAMTISWQDREFALKHIIGNTRKPTMPEKKLSYIIRNTCPHIFRYNGDARLRIVFGGKIPDFVDVNGKKGVIEMFGSYWHGEKKTGRTKEEEEQRFHTRYAKYGYSCLIIWEHELRDRGEVKRKLREFVNL